MLWALSQGDRSKLDRHREGAVAPRLQPLASVQLVFLAASTVLSVSLQSRASLLFSLPCAASSLLTLLNCERPFQP